MHDVLDAFLQLCLNFEQSNTPSLQNFVSWMKSIEADVKREQDLAQDFVRVMTVHNAKGLEAKWVIVADTVSMPGKRNLPDLYELPVPQSQKKTLIWASGEKHRLGPIHEAKDEALREQLKEYRRLLYVALTRAEQCLIIAGAESSKMPEDCWYQLCADALTPHCRLVQEDAERFRYVYGDDLSSINENIRAPDSFVLPKWVKPYADEAQNLQTSISPSKSYANNQIQKSKLPEKDTGRLYGDLVHKLLQILPHKNSGDWREIGEKILCGSDTHLSDELKQTALDEVVALLNADTLQFIFSRKAISEAAITRSISLPNGTIKQIDGRIDRLVIDDQNCWIIDFKTGSSAPQSQRLISYITQLALYREAIKPRFPDLTLHCALVWTSEQRLELISDQRLDQALASLSLNT